MILPTSEGIVSRIRSKMGAFKFEVQSTELFMMRFLISSILYLLYAVTGSIELCEI